MCPPGLFVKNIIALTSLHMVVRSVGFAVQEKPLRNPGSEGEV